MGKIRQSFTAKEKLNVNVRADCWLNVSFHVISTAPEKLYQSIAQIFHKNISLYKLNV